MAETLLLSTDDRPDTEVVLLTVEAAGRRMGVRRSMAYLLVADGELPVVDVARKGAKRPKLRVHVDAVDAWIRRREQAMAS